MQMKTAMTSTLAACVLAMLSFVAPVQAVPVTYGNPGVEAPAPGGFTAGISGFLVGYFTGLRGSFTNFAGARINGVDGPVGLNNQTSAYGDRFVFGQVNAGDALAFFIDVVDTGDRFYSNPALNSDGVNHTWNNGYLGDALVPGGFNLAFEDLLSGGDFNYTDHSFVIAIEQRGAVPEPGSIVLLASALGVLACLARRRKPVTRVA